jgi:hypothetical protein
MQNLMTIENISSDVFHHMRLKLNIHQSELWAKWVVYQYDRPHCRFILWGLQSDKSKILPIVQRIYDETLKKLSDCYELLQCGPIKANFESGLICTHINTMTNALRDWLKKIIGIEWDEIKNHDFQTEKILTKLLLII